MAGDHPGGGSQGIGQLIEEGYGGALRADFQRFYGLDFVDLWRGTLTPRRAWTLIEHLPEDAALAVSMAGGHQHRGWTIQTHLLAQLLNAVRFADANNIRANGGKLNEKPKPVPVPTSTAPKKKRIDLSRHPLAKPIPTTKE